MGGRAGEAAAPRPRSNLGLDARVTFSGALAWPYLYPWPQRPAGLVEDGLRRTRQALEADPRRLRRCRRRRLLRDPSGRGPVRRRDLRDVPRRGRRPPALQHPLRSRRTSCCSSSTISTSSTSTTSGSRCSTSRTPSSIRPAGRASIRGYQGWVDRAGRFRSLGDGQVDFGGIFSKLAAIRLRRLGRAGMGMLPQASRGRRARRRAVHRAATSSASPRRRSTISPAAGRTKREPQMLGIRDDRTDCSLRTRHGHRQAESDSGRQYGRRSASAWSAAGRAPSSARVHRIAARIDDDYELVAGALSSDPGAGARPRPPNSASIRRAATAATRRWRRPRPSGRTASRRWRSSRRTTCTARPPRPSSRPASTSSATSR